MAAAETFANQPTTTVSSGGTTAPSPGTSESWTVASSSSFPAAATGVTQFHVCDTASGKSSEIILVTNVSGSTWTVTRGAESTAPVAHTAGFTIVQVVTAGFLGGVVVNPMTTSGDTIYGGASGAPARLAGDTSNTRKFYREQSSGGVAQPPVWDTLQAGDVPTLNQNTTGTASNITDTLDQVPAPAANVSLNSHKITSLANGSGAQDAAAVGQLPTALTPIAIQTSAYAPVNGQFVPVDVTGGSVTVTLPATPSNNTLIGVKLAALSGSNTVTVAGNGATFNDGVATSITFSLLNQGAVFCYNTALNVWWFLSDDLPLPALDARYVASVTAADSSVTIAGSSTAPTVASVAGQLVQRIFCV